MKTFLLIFLLQVCFNFSFSQVRLDSGLVAYYPFNGNANDSSGNHNDPVFNNASLTADYLGNANSAYHFDGLSNYMMIPNSPSLNLADKMSISLRVRPMGFYTGPCYNNMMIMKGDRDYIPGTYFLRFSDVIWGCTNTPKTTGEQFYGSGVVATNPIVQINQWYNVTWTYNGITAKIYIDCNLMNSYDSAFSPFTSAFDLYIGKLNSLVFPYWLNGDLDDIRIYDRALSELEIAALCPAGGPLPVTLTKFEANSLGKAIYLSWQIESEDGILNYTVERSSTGRSDFVPLKTFVVKNAHAYSFIDNMPEANRDYYYRLAIVEKTGSIHYSEIKMAKVIVKNKLFTVYPNPSKGNIVVATNNYRGNGLFTVTNSVGQVILRKTQLITGNSPITLLNGQQAKGIYWVTLTAGTTYLVEKVMIY